MVLTLPLFFAIGFVAVPLARLFFAGAPWPPAQLDVRARYLLCFIALGVIAILAKTLPQSAGIALAASTVGAFGAWWIGKPEPSKELGLFAAACGIFVFLTAMEYDYGLFRHLTKIGAGTFSAEFSATSKDDRAPDRLQTVTVDASTSPFAGTDLIDQSLDKLRNIGAFAMRDEQFARLLADSDPTIDGSAIDGMDEGTRYFALLGCGPIRYFADRLASLQGFHRSERSALAVDSKLIALMRRIYYLESRRLHSSGDDEPANPTEVEKQILLTSAALEEAWSRAQNWTLRDYNSLSVKMLRAESREKPQKTPIECGNLDRRYRRSLTIVSDSIPMIEYFPAVAADILRATAAFPPHFSSDTQRGYVAYLALTVALAESAIGNRESAIHLLDNEILKLEKAVEKNREWLDRGDPTCATAASAVSGPECRSHAMEVLAYYRLRVIIVRLDTVLFDLIQWQPSPSISASTLQRLLKFHSELLDLLRVRDPKFDRYNSYFSPNADEGAGAICSDSSIAPGSSAEAVKAKLFGKLVLQALIAQNNALDVVVTNRDVAAQFPEMIERLDKFVRSIVAYDADCFQRVLGKTGVVPHTRALMLYTVASYLEAKGENFDSAWNDRAQLAQIRSNPSDAIGALCRARRYYAEAAKAYPDPSDTAGAGLTIGDGGDISPLDDELPRAYNANVATALQQHWNRVDRSISAYPVGDLPDWCREGQP
jgi:hypothetical protein